MSWFYNKTITLLKQTDGYMYHGSWINGELKEYAQIKCDVQPANRELIFKEYGYYINCSMRVFCDMFENLTEGDYIKYKDNTYQVIKLIRWDDYIDMFMQELEKNE